MNQTDVMNIIRNKANGTGVDVNGPFQVKNKKDNSFLYLISLVNQIPSILEYKNIYLLLLILAGALSSILLRMLQVNLDNSVSVSLGTLILLSIVFII
jgi:hypothetical protein